MTAGFSLPKPRKPVLEEKKMRFLEKKSIEIESKINAGKRFKKRIADLAKSQVQHKNKDLAQGGVMLPDPNKRTEPRLSPLKNDKKFMRYAKKNGIQ
jgi:hypothetical protein